MIFTAPKHFAFRDPHLTASIEGDELVITADAYSKSVEITSPDLDFIIDDNYFDMHPGTRRLRILEGTPKPLTLRSVYDIR